MPNHSLALKDSPILEYEAQLRHAQLASDVVALNRLLDDTLVFTALDGSVVGKNGDLSLLRSGRLRVIKIEPDDCRVLELGDVAVVSVQMQKEAILDGVQTQGPLRYTRVWCKRAEDGGSSPVTWVPSPAKGRPRVRCNPLRLRSRE